MFATTERGAAQSATTIWSATLTVDAVQDKWFGCSNLASSILNQDNCSSSSVLTEDEFTYDGITFTFKRLYWFEPQNHLVLGFEGSYQGAAGLLSSLTLTVDGAAIPFPTDRNLIEGTQVSYEFDPDPDWTDGQQVTLSLTKSATPSTTTLSPEAGAVGQAVQRSLDALTDCGGASKSGQPALFADCVALLKARPHLVNEWGSFSDATVHRNKINNFALNWSPDVPLADWFGVTVGNYKSQQRIKRIELPRGHTMRFEHVSLTPPFPTRILTMAAIAPTLWGRIPDVLGELTALNVIDFTGQRLGGPIPAAIGRLPQLRSLFLANNRLTLASPEAMLPTFEYPQRMERIRLLPNGPVPTDYAYRYIDNEGVEHRACLPGVWLDTDRDNDNLTNRSERNLQGVKYYKGRPSATEPLFKPCE